MEAGRVDVDWGHEQGRHQLALHSQTHPASQRHQSVRQELPVAPVDGRSGATRLGPVSALIWRGEGDEDGGQRSGAVSEGASGDQGVLQDQKEDG